MSSILQFCRAAGVHHRRDVPIHSMQLDMRPERWSCAGRFLSGEGDAADKNCGNRFKLIPSVVKGSWVIKQAVGNTPVLLGNKLDTKYFRCASCQ